MDKILVSSVILLPKECGVRLLATPINRPRWWKGKLALFQIPAAQREGGGRLSKGQLPTTTTGNQWARAFTEVLGARGLHAETAQSSLTFRWVIGGLTSVILIVLGPVNLQFQGPFVSISLRPVFRIAVARMSWVQSGHHVANSSTCYFSIYKTDTKYRYFSIYKTDTNHRIWLSILSTALEKELKVLDYA